MGDPKRGQGPLSCPLEFLPTFRADCTSSGCSRALPGVESCLDPLLPGKPPHLVYQVLVTMTSWLPLPRGPTVLNRLVAFADHAPSTPPPPALGLCALSCLPGAGCSFCPEHSLVSCCLQEALSDLCPSWLQHGAPPLAPCAHPVPTLTPDRLSLSLVALKAAGG